MIVYIAEKGEKRILGKVKSEKDINYDKYSIVAFCKTENEMNEIYKLYLENKELEIEEKAVVKNEVHKK